MIQTLADALSERGYETLTPVQEAVTDPALSGADLLVSAQTGSGKTVGFGLAIAPTLLDEAGMFGPAGTPLALVIAPTRELAFQVKRELDWLYAKTGARTASCVGGMDMRDERRALERGAHIVVGTPGRLRDHIQRGSLDMSGLRAVVLDEADEMLDLGFREDLEFMLGEAPEDRRTLMFSATVPPMIATLAQHYQRDAVRVQTISERSQHADIAYQALKVAERDAENAIINLLRYHEAQNAIVFANTRATVSRLTARFANRGFQVVSLSGELSQSERSHALQAMRDGRARVCVATDVAARGIDLPNLELVIHAELPTNTEGLLHRSGRTGRAGRKGISALVVTPKAVKKTERLLKWAKVTAEWTTAPTAEEILRRDEERLLGDAAFSDEMNEDETAFAARLLAERSPEAVAAACLRLYRARHSAPEELSAPDERPAPRERAPFGPSAWVALSVGRDDRAEARWLLPLLCRAGALTKEAIGAIRVQQNETFVELSEPSLAGFLAALGPDNTLEDGVTVRQADGPPEGGRPPRADGPAPTKDRPRAPRPPREAPPPRAESPETGDRHERKPRAKKPEYKQSEYRQSEYKQPDHRKSEHKKAEAPAAQDTRTDTAPARKIHGHGGDALPKWKRDKPGGKGKPSGGPRHAGGPKTGGAGKPPGKAPGQPARANASDTSKRFTPPKGAKPGGKGGAGGKPGGTQPPRRGKR